MSCWALQLTTVSSPPRTSPRSLKWPAVVFRTLASTTCPRCRIPRRRRHGATWSSPSLESISWSVQFAAADPWRGVPFAMAPRAVGRTTHRDPFRLRNTVAARAARCADVCPRLIDPATFAPAPAVPQLSSDLAGTARHDAIHPFRCPSTIWETTFPIAPNPRLSSTLVCWKGHRHRRVHGSSRWTTPASRATIHSNKALHGRLRRPPPVANPLDGLQISVPKLGPMM